MRGQNWGLPPLIPDRLRGAAYAPFIDTLRASMRHAGALRIDHVMGLMRLFWIPDGKDADAGAYVRYPFADLLGILALESQRHRCLVIGEDLGTVPEEVRTALAAAGVLSYRLLYFERDGAGDFKPPSSYPAQALVAASTHDLPTLAGWWRGRDIALRDELGLFPSKTTRSEQLDARKEIVPDCFGRCSAKISCPIRSRSIQTLHRQCRQRSPRRRRRSLRRTPVADAGDSTRGRHRRGRAGQSSGDRGHASELAAQAAARARAMAR
mgnify:CR=1 FL=1